MQQADPSSTEPSGGVWWYQYPDGTWVWWSASEARWVRIDPPRTAKTPAWVFLIVIVAALLWLVFGAMIARELPDILRDEIRRSNPSPGVNV